MITTAQIHNRDVGDIVKAIVKPTLDAGGEFSDVLVILESVIFGVMLFAERTGGDGGGVLDELVDGVRARLEQQRLKEAKTAGTA